MKNPYLNFENQRKLLDQNKVLKFCLVLSALAVVYMAMNYVSAIENIKIEILPSPISKQITLGKGTINADGALSFARLAFDRLLNHTPKSADVKFNEFLLMVHEDSYAAIKKELDDELSAIRRLKIVSTFNIEDLYLDEANSLIEVKGLRTRTSFGKALGKKPSLWENWRLKYKICDYNFKIIEIKKDA